MSSIIVAFSNMENAKNIKNILTKNGFRVNGVSITAAHALGTANELGDGILVCGTKLRDMGYQELYQNLPEHFEMLLLAKPEQCDERGGERMLCLSMPLKAHELLHTVSMMADSIARKKKRRNSKPRQRSEEEQKLIREAKELLMETNLLTEAQAHSYIQKRSMESGSTLTETAQRVLAQLR
ncbi:hypothetical protein FACS1894111_07680 [Clostridia bacterium]|nr:hypothetical protein FACS1894111_07680 [Clostridia bacterium]